MISANSIASIDWLFERSVRENSSSYPDDACIITNVSHLPSGVTEENRELVVLNISSYVFRIVAMIEFSKNKSTIAHLARTLRRPESELEGQALLDAYAEFINMICGAVNRKLCNEFRHVGMSTPFFIDHKCANSLSMLNPTATRCFEFVIDELTRYKLTVCVCVGKEKSLDFVVDRNDQEDVSNGELELF